MSVPRKEWTDAPSNLGAIDPRGAWAKGWNACALLVEHMAEVAKIRPEAARGFMEAPKAPSEPLYVIGTDNKKFVRVEENPTDPSRFTISLVSEIGQAKQWADGQKCNNFRMDFLKEISRAGCHASHTMRI